METQHLLREIKMTFAMTATSATLIWKYKDNYEFTIKIIKIEKRREERRRKKD
jgi:hypothetical protein